MSVYEPGEGNAALAVALLDVLAEDGDGAARARVLRALETDEVSLRGETGWLDSSRLERAWRTGGVDLPRARRIGRALVTPARIDWVLLAAGVATVEKGLRRVQRLLVRDAPGSQWRPLEIGRSTARLAYAPDPDAPTPHATTRALQVAMRCAMLEALPLHFGLAHAQAKHLGTDGGEEIYALRWRTASRRGAAIGAVLALALAVVFALATSLAPWGIGTLGIACGILGALAGRAFDLGHQLQQIGVRRLGDATLVDRADRALAEKLDAIARIDALLEGGDAAPESLQQSDAEVPARRAPSRRQPSSMEAIAERAVAAVRNELPDCVQLELKLEPPIPRLLCDAFQVEQLLLQLLRNGVEASEEAVQQRGGEGRVVLALSADSQGGGVEVAVLDDGLGIEPDAVDRAFDPFEGPDTAGAGGGFGLAVSARIVEAHGGEIRMESESGRGTRVSVWLPVGGRSR